MKRLKRSVFWGFFSSFTFFYFCFFLRFPFYLSAFFFLNAIHFSQFISRQNSNYFSFFTLSKLPMTKKNANWWKFGLYKNPFHVTLIIREQISASFQFFTHSSLDISNILFDSKLFYVDSKFFSFRDMLRFLNYFLSLNNLHYIIQSMTLDWC